MEDTEKTVNLVITVADNRGSESWVPGVSAIVGPQLKRIEDKGLGIIRLLDVIEKRARGEPESVLWKTSVQNTYKRMTERYGKPLIDALLGTKIDVYLLLNSNGVPEYIQNPVLEALASFKRRYGLVKAYVTGRCGGSAANILSAADERYAMEDSRLVWRLSEQMGDVLVRTGLKMDGTASQDPVSVDGRERNWIPSGHDEEIARIYAEESQKSWRNIRRFLEDNTRNEYMRPMVATRLDAAENDKGNTRNEVVFTGRELGRAGVLHDVYRDSRSMFEKFCGDTGIALDLNSLNNAVSRFFMLSGLERELFNEGWRVEIMPDGKSDRLNVYLKCASKEEMDTGGKNARHIADRIRNLLETQKIKKEISFFLVHEKNMT